MPGSKFSLEKSQNNEALAAAVGASGMGYPVPNPPGSGQDANSVIAAMLQGGGGKMDPKMLMALLALLAGMGPQGPMGAQGMPQAGAPQEGGANPIAAAYGG